MALVDRTCELCGSGFKTKPYEVKRGYGRFCSKLCGSRNNQIVATDAIRVPGGYKVHQRIVRKARSRYKDNARNAVLRAVRTGKLIREPCEVCGDVKSEGHHEDYSKQLDVVWLCTKHHKERHRELRKIAQACPPER